jgi:hypothetical protein
LLGDRLLHALAQFVLDLPQLRTSAVPPTFAADLEGFDEDFGKSKPLYKITRPPFYAAWATPVVHDTRAGCASTPDVR